MIHEISSDGREMEVKIINADGDVLHKTTLKARRQVMGGEDVASVV